MNGQVKSEMGTLRLGSVQYSVQDMNWGKYYVMLYTGNLSKQNYHYDSTKLDYITNMINCLLYWVTCKRKLHSELVIYTPPHQKIMCNLQGTVR